MINYEALNNFIGEPWIYKENDCWTLFVDASKNVLNRVIEEINIPTRFSYRESVKLFEKHKATKNWQKIETPKTGCAVLFLRNKHAVHIGLYIEKGNIIHCDGSTKYEHINNLKHFYDGIEFYINE